MCVQALISHVFKRARVNACSVQVYCVCVQALISHVFKRARVNACSVQVYCVCPGFDKSRVQACACECM